MRYQIYDDFLTAEECQQLIEMAKPRLERSTGWDVGTGKQTVTDYRTSYQMYFNRGENPLISKIEQTIADLVGLPVENGEQIQVLHYQAPNGHYKPHWDFFDPQYPQNQQILEHGGQRILTFMCFLNNVEKGGETHFPNEGLKIKPKQGMGVMWLNMDFVNGEGVVDKSTLHEGCDVLEGEKFIFTRWVREKEFI